MYDPLFLLMQVNLITNKSVEEFIVHLANKIHDSTPNPTEHTKVDIEHLFIYVKEFIEAPAGPRGVAMKCNTLTNLLMNVNDQHWGYLWPKLYDFDGESEVPDSHRPRPRFNSFQDTMYYYDQVRKMQMLKALQHKKYLVQISKKRTYDRFQKGSSAVRDEDYSTIHEYLQLHTRHVMQKRKDFVGSK